MSRGSFATMQSQTTTEVTFYYDNGHSESFKIPVPAQQFQPQVQQMLAQPWLTFHLSDQTVVVSTAKIVKIEIKPAISGLEGEGVFSNSERVTTMQRATAARIGVDG